MPTRRPRHMITETPPVERALRRLRALQGERIDLKELVILGAQEKAERLEREGGDPEGGRNLVEDFLALGADDVDVAVALGAHESGWARER